MSAISALLLAIAVQSTGTLVQGRESSSYVGSVGNLRTIDGPMNAKPSDQALLNARGMMACTVKRRPALTEQLLDTTDVTHFQKLTTELGPTLQKCAGETGNKDAAKTELKFSSSMMRSLIAEASLAQKGLPALAPIAYVATAPGSEWLTGDPGRRIVLRMADCLSAKEPRKVEAILAAPSGSGPEGAAFSALAPTFPACLEKNVTLTTNRVGLRLALASALDRRSRQPALATEAK